MADLVQSLATGPQVQWIVATVTKITGATITVDCFGGEVEDVTPINQYIPQVGDVTHILALESHGMLAIGSVPLAAVRPEPAPTGQEVILDPTIMGTVDLLTGQWELGTVVQALDRMGCWFYSQDDLQLSGGIALAGVAIEVTLTSGEGPPEFVEHAATEPVGIPAILTEVPFGVQPGAVGVPTWLDLPLDWGMDLITGVAHGIGVVSSLFTGDYTTSSGRLRLTPV